MVFGGLENGTEVKLYNEAISRVLMAKHNGFMVESGARWASAMHVKGLLLEAKNKSTMLMVARTRLGSPSPYRFFRLYCTKVESAFQYGAESYMDCPMLIWRELNSVQMRIWVCRQQQTGPWC